MFNRHGGYFVPIVLFLLPGGIAVAELQGPYVAGHEVFEAIDSARSDRAVLTNVWYPVDNADAVGQPPLQYYQHYNGGSDFWWYDSPFLGGVQGTEAAGAGEFPLVVLSHGNGGYTNSFAMLGESLASHGYVVVAPRHTGNAWGTPNDSDNSRRSRNRSIDLTFVTDKLLERNATPGDILHNAIDENRIGIGGYSAGVPTAASLFVGTTSYNTPVPTDTRAKAMLALDGRLWWTSQTRDVPVTTHLIGAIEEGIPFDDFNIDTPVLYSSHIADSHHWSFGTLLCQFADALAASDAPPEVFDTTGQPGNYGPSFWPGCQSHLIDPDEAQRQVAMQSRAFFDAHLNDQSVAAELMPETASPFTLEATVVDASRGSLLLVDPIGRRLGNDPNDGFVDELDGLLSNVTGWSNNRQVFRIDPNDLLPGEYTVYGESVLQPADQIDFEGLLDGFSDMNQTRFRIRKSSNLTPSFEPLIQFVLLPGIDGDFDEDGDYSCLDVDALVREIAAGTDNLELDLNGDGQVDRNDLTAWRAEAGAAELASGNPYSEGDANLDGVVDVRDFNAWNDSKFTATASWCSGDFNADGFVDVGDFNIWNDNKFTAADVATVPEPSNLGMVLFGFAIVAFRSAKETRSSLGVRNYQAR